MFELNRQYDLGSTCFSEAEIIDFAMRYDPLEFHLDVEKAKGSLFKGLVSSGPHPFHHFYKNHWVPKFGDTVVAGLGIDNWRFLKPVYVDRKVSCVVSIKEMIPHPEKKTVTIRWYFEFRNEKSELVQHLEMIVLHKAG